MSIELSPKDKQNLRKALLIATGAVATGATVQYIRDRDGFTKGYLYIMDRGEKTRAFLLGIFRNLETADFAQISGEKKADDSVVLDEPVGVEPDDVPNFVVAAETVVAQSKQTS